MIPQKTLPHKNTVIRDAINTLPVAVARVLNGDFYMQGTEPVNGAAHQIVASDKIIGWHGFAMVGLDTEGNVLFFCALVILAKHNNKHTRAARIEGNNILQ